MKRGNSSNNFSEQLAKAAILGANIGIPVKPEEKPTDLTLLSVFVLYDLDKTKLQPHAGIAAKKTDNLYKSIMEDVTKYGPKK